MLVGPLAGAHVCAYMSRLFAAMDLSWDCLMCAHTQRVALVEQALPGSPAWLWRCAPCG